MMLETIQEKRKNLKNWILLFLGMLILRACMDLNYWLLLAGVSLRYPAVDFDPLRYGASWLWCVVLFLFIRHNEKKASSFLLNLTLILQILPVSVIYGLCGMGSAYYHVLCGAFLLCELLAGCASDRKILERNTFLSNVMHTGYAMIVPVVLAVIYLTNGLPSLMALDMSQVYELRGSDAFQLNKYVQYLLTWSTSFFVPMLLARAICNKKYLIALALAAVQFLFYLYTGHKTYLFTIPLVVLCAFWSRRKHFYRELFFCLCAGMSVLLLLAVLAEHTEIFPEMLGKLFVEADSYLFRRTMVVPAVNKFIYFDYFSANPKLGLAGIFPTWLLPVDNPYADIAYTYEISAIYYGLPEMNSNTGFLAEGFSRFGHMGTFLVLLVFALLLRQMDSLQNRLGYGLIVSIFVYPVFALGDAYLLDQLLFGRWMPILLFFLFCQRARETAVSRRLTWGFRRVTLR